MARHRKKHKGKEKAVCTCGKRTHRIQRAYSSLSLHAMTATTSLCGIIEALDSSDPEFRDFSPVPSGERVSPAYHGRDPPPPPQKKMVQWHDAEPISSLTAGTPYNCKTLQDQPMTPPSPCTTTTLCNGQPLFRRRFL